MKEGFEPAAQPRVRLDKWLWAARFFKTRSLAARAVSGGHVHVNGDRAKPARSVQVGDTLDIRRGVTAFEVVVLQLNDRRGPAVKARTMYEETPGSIERRTREAAERRLRAAAGPAPAGRPDKRERRKIRKFIRKD
ncbi:MAG: ribosome-associated heat shock protein Hsp15 [Desulfobulbaceae bacterium]